MTYVHFQHPKMTPPEHRGTVPVRVIGPFHGSGSHLLPRMGMIHQICMKVFMFYMLLLYFTQSSLALCVEWARAHARMQCWAEEVRLLQEEMCRVLQFFEYCAAWWEDQKSLHTSGLLLDLSDGLRAYAAK